MLSPIQTRSTNKAKGPLAGRNDRWNNDSSFFTTRPSPQLAAVVIRRMRSAEIREFVAPQEPDGALFRHYGTKNRFRPQTAAHDTRRRGLLVVFLRSFQDPTVLRRCPQGNRTRPEEVHPHRGKNRRDLQLQAFLQRTLLRRIARQAPGVTSGSLTQIP